MNYRIIEKPSFSVTGMVMRTTNTDGTNLRTIPQFRVKCPMLSRQHGKSYTAIGFRHLVMNMREPRTLRRIRPLPTAAKKQQPRIPV